MREVLISIQPRWVEKIVSGEKTVEVRKTRPKCETPFKCYIYCTQGKLKDLGIIGDEIYQKRMKVIGEFVCDRFIESFLNNNDGWFVELGCLTPKEIDEYQGDKAILYGWHITDLVVYDEPMELSEFYTLKKCNSCESGYESTACIYDEDCKVPVQITRPPQSWCYIETRQTAD